MICKNCKQKRAYFNIPGSKQAKYCAKCAFEIDNTMVDVKNKKCEKCKEKQAYFNIPGVKQAKYCSNCAFKIDKTMVDVKTKKCEKCKEKCATFNIPGSKQGKYCAKCAFKLDNTMVNVKNKKCEKCKQKQANFNIYGVKQAKYCAKCAFEIDRAMVDVKSKKCLICGLTKANRKYRNHCLRCFIHTFPDEPVCRNYKTKEKSVSDFIRAEFANYKWIGDKTIAGGCSKRRPDIMLEIDPFHYLIVEIDENQHNQYDCSCENKRIMQLSQDLNHSNIVFIRFNPDSFKDINNKTIRSVWTTNKQTGILYVSQKNIKEWEMRLGILRNNIQYWIDNKSDKMIETVQLFFDQYQFGN
jgi:hypothetical protein